MKVYLMTDLEGVSGVVHIDYMDKASDYYRTARALLTQDVNAAVAGCFDAGAAEVVVRDAHSAGTNLVTELLDPRAALDGSRDRWWGVLDGSFAATMMIGQHAMAGTLDGFLDHTQSSASWFDYRINGRRCGEIGQWATVAGHHRVPLVYLCGDEAACREARALVRGVVTTMVKRGHGRNRASGLHPARARGLIRRDAARALALRRPPRPLRWRKPLTVRLTLYRSDMADDRMRPGLRRVDARTIEKRARSQLDILF